MARITTEIIKEICTKDGQFCVPDRIKASIEGCLVNNNENLITEKYRSLKNQFIGYRQSTGPAQIDYNDDLTVDAYIVYYLSRYTIIPSVALRDLTLHPFFQNVPDSFRVLDLGSGTGAVVLGLLSLFSTSPLSRVAINITALDCCAKALDRQKKLIEKASFNPEQVHHCEADICDIDRCMKLATKEGPYYLIFLANCLTELEQDVAINLVGRLPEILADNGAIVIAEAQRDYIKKLVRTLATTAESLGLHVYYPCPTTDCPYVPWCWVWRDHKYDIPSIEVDGQPLQEEARDKLTLSWLILTRQNVSIYDVFTKKRPDLLWGPISKETENKRSACYGNQSRPFEMDYDVSLSYKRGSIVGLSSEFEVKEYHEM